MNISVFSVANLQKVCATLAVFAMVFSPFTNVPFASAAQGDYQINSSSFTLTGTVLQLNGTSFASPQTGANNTQHMAVDWDDDKNIASNSWQNESTGQITFTPTFFGGNGGNADGFNATWSATHDFAAFGSGTYTVRVLVYHGNTPGGDGSGLDIVSFTIVIPPPATDATLTLQKSIVNNNGGTALDTAFTLTATGPTTGVTGVEGDLAITNKVVTAGVYTLSESSLAGYTNGTTWSCTDGVVTNGNTLTLTPNDTAICTITNDDAPATLTLIKNKVGGPALATDWTLSAAGPTPVSGSTGVSASVNAGTYTLSESPVVALYSPSDWQCTGTTVTAGNQITLANGDNATCTITNTYTPTHGTLNLTKVLGTLFGAVYDESAFSYLIDGLNETFFDEDGNVQVALPQGSHTVSETLLSGFAVPIFGGSCGSTGLFSIVADQTTDCTITNNGIQPKLTLTKVVVNDEAPRYQGTAVVGDFSLFAGTEQFVSGVDEGINVGTYTLSETGPTSGYNASYSCVKNGGATTTENTISLGLGDVASCTITNDDKDPSTAQVSFIKNVVGGYSLLDQLPSAFSFDVEGGAVDTNVAHGGSTELPVGTFTVTEVGPTAGYATTFGGDCNADGTLNVEAGDLAGTLSCTITNTELPACSNGINDDGREDELVDALDPGCTGPSDDDETDPVATITIDKVVVGEGASVSEAFTFDTWLTENTLLSAQGEPVSFTNLKPGTYSFSEINLPLRWSVEGIACTDATGPENDLNDALEGATLNVSLGEHITCVITNRYTPRDSGGNDEYVVVEKRVTEGSDTTEVFGFTVTGSNEYSREFSLAHGQSNGASIELNADEVYSVREVGLPSGWNKPTVACVSSKNSEREISPSEFVLNDGEIVTCTFTNDQDLYELKGFVWEDADADGIFDIDESPLTNWSVQATAEGETTRETATDENGQYLLMVPEGTWTITENLQNGWNHTFPSPAQYVVTVPQPIDEEPIEELSAFILGLFVGTAHAAIVDTLDGFNFGNKQESSGGSSSGSRRKRPVETPVPQVLGEATSTMPVGAPNTGAGGTDTPTKTSAFAVAVAAAQLRRNKNVR